MKSIKKYNIYVFISTFTRNIIDVYSVIYLYKHNFSIKNIIAIYAICYFLGSFISNISIVVGNKIGYKYILVFSSIITSITFYVIHSISNLYIISIFLSLSMFTYHPIRHLYGIKLLKYKKKIGNTLIFMYIASLLSSYIAINDINLMYLVAISILGIIPAIFIDRNNVIQIIKPKNITRRKLNFFFFDQFKIIFILLEPLYLYLIWNDISYVGYLNIILTLSSIICIYILTSKVNLNKYYKYINILFTIILVFKLNIYSKNLLLVIALLEGIGIRTNELVSTINLYDYDEIGEGYIIISERFFCIIRALVLSIIYFLPLDLKIILYILLVGIFILSFQYKKRDKLSNL